MDPVRGESSENVSRNRGGGAPLRLGKRLRAIGGGFEGGVGCRRGEVGHVG